MHKLDIEKCSNSYIRKWNVAASEIFKKTGKEVLSDIRLFFQRV